MEAQTPNPCRCPRPPYFRSGNAMGEVGQTYHAYIMRFLIEVARASRILDGLEVSFETAFSDFWQMSTGHRSLVHPAS